MVRIISGVDQAGICQSFHLRILDQLFRANRSAKATVVTLTVVDHRQVFGDRNSTLGTDLLTQTTAHTANGTSAGGNRALCHRVAGDDHIPVGLHGDDQISGADIGASHTTHAAILVDHRHTVDDDRCVG